MNDDTRHLMHEGVLMLLSAVIGGFIGGTTGGYCKQYYFEKHTYFHHDNPPFVKEIGESRSRDYRKFYRKPEPFNGPMPENER